MKSTRGSGMFCLSQLDGLSYDDVAAELGLTVNYVGVLLTCALVVRRKNGSRRLRAGRAQEKVPEVQS